MKMRKVDDVTNDATSTLSKKWHEMNSWQDNIGQGIDVSKEFDADFNFPKIHFMSLWVEQIRRYRAVQQYSATKHEQGHKVNLKAGWNTSSHNHNHLSDVINFQHCIPCSISKLSLRIRRTELLPAMSFHPVLIWLPL